MEDHYFNEGKWVNEPVTIPANVTKMLAFKASGRIASPLGTEGWIRYSADQGKVKFTARWNVPVSSDNTLSLISEGEKGNLYAFTVENFTKHLQNVSPVVTISKK